MDNCLTPKKAITKLNRLTGVKWMYWHGKNTAIKRCVVTLTPIAINNMDSSLQYLMPMGDPPVFGPDLFVKMYFKGKSSRLKFLPAIKFDFDNLFLPEIVLPPYSFGMYTIILSAKLTGQMVIKKQGEINSSALSVNHLKSFEVSAGMALKDFRDSLYLDSLGLGSKQLSIGSHITNEFWTTSFELRGNTIIATITPQPIIISMSGYEIMGNLGFEISGTLVPKKLSLAPSHSAIQVSSMGEVEIVLSVFVLQPLVKIGNKLAEIRDTLGPFAGA